MNIVNLARIYQKEILIFLGLIITYFFLRLPNLTLQPIFADEAIYIRWAQVMKSEPTLRFLPQSDGKTPLFMWVMIPMFKIFSDPLFAGRFLSVIAGFFTFLGVFFLAKKVFNIKIALWASFLYTITPYTIFFDRMALVDSMLASFTVWIIYFAIWLAQTVRLDIAMFLGYLLGGAVLTKTPGMINFLLIPLSILAAKKEEVKRNSLLRLFLFWVVAIAIGFTMYNFLRLGPQFHLLSSRNQDYIFSPIELISQPFDPFIPHLRDLADWFPKLFTWPVLIAIAGGIWLMFKTKNRLGLIVLLWALIPIFLSIAFLKTFTARYLLTSITPLLLFAGFGIDRIFQIVKAPGWLKLLVLVVIIALLPLRFDYQLITNPPPDSLPKEGRIGYFEAWTAGYGLKDIAEFLKERRREGKVVVGTEGFFGTLPDGLWIYLDKDDIPILGSHATVSAQIRNSAKENQTYFVGNKRNLEGTIEKMMLIREYPKVKSQDNKLPDATVLYQVLP